MAELECKPDPEVGEEHTDTGSARMISQKRNNIKISFRSQELVDYNKYLISSLIPHARKIVTAFHDSLHIELIRYLLLNYLSMRLQHKDATGVQFIDKEACFDQRSATCSGYPTAQVMGITLRRGS